MRLGNRSPKNSFRDWASYVGLIAAEAGLVAMIWGAAFWMGVAPLLDAHRDGSIRGQVLAVPPLSTSDAEGPVVLRGRIDPRQPVPVGGGGLALVERESLRTNWAWDWELIHHPEFELLLEDGSVQVVNGCRRVQNGWFRASSDANGAGERLDDCYRLGGTWVVAYDGTNPNRRFIGFRPGDEVNVVGTLHGGRLHATSVFGGSPEDYASSLWNSPWVLALGPVVGLALLAASVMIGYMVLCCSRWWWPSAGQPDHKASARSQ